MCPYPDCGRSVPSTMFACRSHWFALSAELRRRIWANYRSGDLGRIAEGYEDAAIEWGLGWLTL